jgi:hypothetical protein
MSPGGRIRRHSPASLEDGSQLALTGKLSSFAPRLALRVVADTSDAAGMELQ